MHHVGMGLATFAIEANADGSIGLMLNGQDLGERVQALHLEVAEHTLPQLQVRLSGEGQVAGEGIVQVIQTAEDVAVDLGHVVRVWLGQIDPGALMEDAMRNAPLHAGAAELVLAALSERALEDFQ